MNSSPFNGLRPAFTWGAAVERQGSGTWRLSIPGGPAGAYRQAQLDDTHGKRRDQYTWRLPGAPQLRMRASAAELPGTWGFGLWNDPFQAGFGVGGGGINLGALPNAAWFFQASPPNYLSLRDSLPAQGFMAGVFSSPHLPTLLLAPGLVAAPLLALPPAARLLRRLARVLVKEDAAQLQIDPTQWHEYGIELSARSTRFTVDQALVLETALTPRPPLGLVIWIDNQFAAFTPAGRISSGTLANEAAWIEVEYR